MHFFPSDDERPHSVARGIRAWYFIGRISARACFFFPASLLPRARSNRNYCCINGARIPRIGGEYISVRARVTSATVLIANIFPPERNESPRIFFPTRRDKITLGVFFSSSHLPLPSLFPLSGKSSRPPRARDDGGCGTYFSHGAAPASWSRLINPADGGGACPIYGLKWKMERDGYSSRAVGRDNLAEEEWISDK